MISQRPRFQIASQQLWALIVAVAAFGFVMIGAAQAGDVEPDRFLQEFGNGAIEVIGNKELAPEERRTAFSGLLAEGFYMDRIAKLALGQHWRSASEDERKSYSRAFKSYVVATYDRRLSGYSGQKLSVKGWRPVKKDALVESEIEGDGQRARIEWRLTETDQGWRILDIVVEGVSMLVTQRNEFSAIIEREGSVAALIDHLERAGGTSAS